MQSLVRGRYRLVEQLRDQTKRQTWLAFDTEEEQHVVLKRLRFDDSFEWSDLKQFERESKTLENLDHPQIPKFIDTFELEEDGAHEFVLVQSYIEAKSLADHIKAGRTFTDFDIKQIAESVLAILSYLHGRHPAVIHRDIKPSNILLGDCSGNSVGRLYLVDFGSVQTPVAKTTDTFTVVGSYGYMAPEQFIGKALPASDLYGLGMTLIYLAEGKHPAELIAGDSSRDWRSNISLSSYLKGYVKQLTEPELSQRLRTVEEAQVYLKSSASLVVEEPSVIPSLLSERYPLSPWHGLPLQYQTYLLGSNLIPPVAGIAIVYIAKVIITGDTSSRFDSILFALALPLLFNYGRRKLFPKSEGYFSSAWLLWGHNLREEGKLSEALAKYDRSIQARPQYYGAWHGRGVVLYRLERYEEAVASHERAIALKPNNWRLWGAYGQALEQLNRYEEAIVSYERGIELKSDYSWAYNRLKSCRARLYS